MPELTMKRSIFVEEYLKDFNATQAAIRAGYSPKTANQQGPALLVKLGHLIDQRKAELLKQAKLTLDEWVQRVTKLAFYDPRRFFDQHNNCKNIQDLDELTAQCLAGYEVEELFEGKGKSRNSSGYFKKFKLLDRTPYVMAVGKYLNAFSDKNPQSPTTQPPSRIPTESLSLEQKLALRNEYVAILKRYNLST